MAGNFYYKIFKSSHNGLKLRVVDFYYYTFYEEKILNELCFIVREKLLAISSTHGFALGYLGSIVALTIGIFLLSLFEGLF